MSCELKIPLKSIEHRNGALKSSWLLCLVSVFNLKEKLTHVWGSTKEIISQIIQTKRFMCVSNNHLRSGLREPLREMETLSGPGPAKTREEPALLQGRLGCAGAGRKHYVKEPQPWPEWRRWGRARGGRNSAASFSSRPPISTRQMQPEAGVEGASWCILVVGLQSKGQGRRQ